MTSPRVWSASGVTVSAWRGLSVVNTPLPAGLRRAISSQRFSALMRSTAMNVGWRSA